MSVTVLVYLKKSGDETDSFLSWRVIQQKSNKLVSDSPIALTGSGSASDFFEYYQNNFSIKENRKRKFKKIEIIGILPGIFVTYASVSVPTNNRKQTIQAIPFLIEDFLIGELDEMHIGIDKNSKEGKARVAIVEKKLINEWISLFGKLNIPFDKIYGAPDIISVSNNEAKIVFFDDYVIFKSDSFTINTSVDNLKKIFSTISLDGIELVNIFCEASEKIPSQISRKIKIEVESEGIAKVEIFEFSGEIIDGHGLLFDNSFSDGIDLSEKNNVNTIGFYRDFMLPIGISVALIAVIQIALNVFSGLYFSKKSDFTLEYAKLNYEKIFSGDPVIDIKDQWEKKLKNSIVGSTDKSFSFVFSIVMRELVSYKGGKNNFKLEEFRFDSESGNLKIDIEVDSISTLDGLKTKLKENAIDMEIASANTDNNIIKASIVVKRT